MKKLYSWIGLFVFFFSLITTTFNPIVKAEEFEEIDEEVVINEVIENSIQGRLFNFVTFPTSANETDVIVKINNIGDSSLDNVKITVQCVETGLGTSKTISNAKIGITTVKLPLNMLKSSERLKVKIVATEKGKTQTTETTVTRKISDSQLAVWHKGTYSSARESLDDHFSRHGREVSATNIVSYFNKAVSYRKEVLNNINKGNTSIYRISVGKGSIPSKKYKHLTDGRYIILADSDSKIFSFGR